jgi:hypothetical protein
MKGVSDANFTTKFRVGKPNLSMGEEKEILT